MVSRHFTPTSSSWINQVKRWFGFLTDQMIRRGTHKSVQALEADVRSWVANWNEKEVLVPCGEVTTLRADLAAAEGLRQPPPTGERRPPRRHSAPPARPHAQTRTPRRSIIHAHQHS